MPLQLIVDTISKFLESPPSKEENDAWLQIPKSQKANIDSIFKSRRLSCRDGIIIQLGYWLKRNKPRDVTIRQQGARTVAVQLGKFLAKNHIKGVKDAYQNIGKNSAQLTRGNFLEFDNCLIWASDNSRNSSEIRAVFHYCCYKLSLLARPVRNMPMLNKGSLEFSPVIKLLYSLINTGSKGAYEQFIIAALLQAILEESGIGGYRVATKNLNASDKSSRTAGDIQILLGNRVIDAFEVTANNWTDKIESAQKTIRDNDLSRLHIIAKIPDYSTALDHATNISEDISILDIYSYTASLVATLTRTGRANCLIRLYELLDRYQPDIKRVNSYVESLIKNGLTELK